MILASIPFFDRVTGILEAMLASMSRSATATVSAFKFLAEAIPLFHSLMSFMPLMIASCASIILGLSVLKFIIGR